MSLWNPKKPLNQPPHFGKTGAAAHDKGAKVDPVVAGALLALREGTDIRRLRKDATIFDRATKGSR